LSTLNKSYEVLIRSVGPLYSGEWGSVKGFVRANYRNGYGHGQYGREL
jgi:hypothetical protein